MKFRRVRSWAAVMIGLRSGPGSSSGMNSLSVHSPTVVFRQQAQQKVEDMQLPQQLEIEAGRRVSITAFATFDVGSAAISRASSV